MLRFATLLLAAFATSANAFTVTGPCISSPVQKPSVALQAAGGFDIASLQDNQDALVAAGASVLLLAGGAAAAATGVFGGSTNKGVAVVEEEPEPEPIDVSIPYDAAAKLAYMEYIEAEEGVEYDEALYQKFKSIFEAKASAEATVKRYNREMASLKVD